MCPLKTKWLLYLMLPFHALGINTGSFQHQVEAKTLVSSNRQPLYTGQAENLILCSALCQSNGQCGRFVYNKVTKDCTLAEPVQHHKSLYHTLTYIG